MVTKTSTMDGAGSRDARRLQGTPGLVLLYAENLGGLPPAIVLTASGLVLGREPPPGGLAIPQSAVSRLHARLSHSDGRWRAVDLDSRNGVLVNGRNVRDATLEHLDEIRIGDVIFKFVADGADAFIPYRIDAPVSDAPGALIGGLSMATLMDEVIRVAPTPMTVSILGETGTGKELVARALHNRSGRTGAFRAMNCAAIPPTLFESELFGFKRGAFTGADRDQVGLIGAAHGGTLLLDEVGDMPLEAQAKMLRILETREVVPLGSTVGERVDVRLICATHRDLRALVAARAFRGDLYARLNAYALRVPALRERKEDLYPLLRHFLRKAGCTDRPVSFRLMTAVCHYDWPFNVRELAATVQRALVVAGGDGLDEVHLPDAVRDAMADHGAPRGAEAEEPAATSALERGRAPEPAALRVLMEKHRGNVAAVARELGRDRAQLYRWMRDAGIHKDDYRR